VKGSRLTLTSLAISGLPRKWSAEIRCSGKKCPFKKKTLNNTKVGRLVLKAGKLPTTTPVCVVPGGAKPQKSCA
jgi:hypothetical protein